MLAQEIRDGDECRDINRALVYTVIHDARVVHTVKTGRIVEVDIMHAVDGGTDLRCFDYNQEVPLVRDAHV